MDTWNEPAPPSRKGLPTWGKVAIGCGIAALLGLGACVVGGVYVFKKGKTMVADLTRKPMEQLSRLVRDAATPEGLEAFYGAHPGLAQRYPDATAFRDAMQNLETRVGPLPTEITDFVELAKSGQLQLNARNEGGKKGLSLTYRNPGKQALISEWEEGRLVDLRVE